MSDQVTDISKHIEENFGTNSTYVEGLYKRFLSDPNLVDDSWRVYFANLSPDSESATRSAEPKKESSNGSSEVKSLPSAAAAPAPEKEDTKVPEGVEAKPIFGASKVIVENMEESLGVPTATSIRGIPVKLLEENRKVINDSLKARSLGKVSFTHLIGYAIIQAALKFPQMNHGFGIVDGKPTRLQTDKINLGIAIDVEKKNGSRNLLVPNLKDVGSLTFWKFFQLFNDTIKRARTGKLTLDDFQGTTISLTNPGMIGTVASNPRLMAGQGTIIATGSIQYPPEYQAMSAEAVSKLGISKVMNITSTYDHRVIQGAESGLFLSYIHECLIGGHDFYDNIFESLEITFPPLRWAEDFNPGMLGEDHARHQTIKQAKVLQLINEYRNRGHLLADIDPLNLSANYTPDLELEKFGLTIWDLDRNFITDGLHGKDVSTLREILWVLRRAYCGKVGIEYRHMQNGDEIQWIREKIREEFVDGEPLAPETQKDLLLKLIEAEQFEQFLHRKYLGQKRFSLEGCETLIPFLDQLVEMSCQAGVGEIFMGMAHRGRLNVLANIVGDAEKGDMAERIFTSFEGTAHPRFPADEGDVKYHQGAIGTRKTKHGDDVKIQLACNPSHLEFVNAVVEGMSRARQDQILGEGKVLTDEITDQVLPILLHGDAAFAGQGIVMETLQLANLEGYRTGGTVHVVINNQIGFTTNPESSRSSHYATDPALMTQLPIFHINADAPESAYRVAKIAIEYRQEFNKDVAIDLIGFRKLGHNEGDEPSYTQPLMYQRVKAHPGVRDKYARQLIVNGIITEDELKEMTDSVVEKYERVLARAKEIAKDKKKEITELTPVPEPRDGSEVLDTAIDQSTINEVTKAITVVPEDFTVNPKMVSQLEKRAKMGSGETKMDWGFAEAIAFGSIVLDGKSVRVSGQDSGRGTFSHRHAILHDTETGNSWCPLSELKSANNSNAGFSVYDSSLSESGVLGFEYGYTSIAQDDLVIWEAQFGDFSNGAQVMIDQYIAASEEKWGETSRLVMLLPHGYEGQGPEHSSARLERYLQLCAGNNMRVCNPTTPAQYFHMLRRQVATEERKPLVVMTPKSLLRLPAASSTPEDLVSGGFMPVIDDSFVSDPSTVERIVICSGKVYYDLIAMQEKQGIQNVAVVRQEQLYPFPYSSFEQVFKKYPNAGEIVWSQEEPRNMGAWTFVKPRFEDIKPDQMILDSISRRNASSPATGSYGIHNLEQKRLVELSLGIEG